MRGLFVTGTDTGVGKSFVAAGLARALSRRGESVRVFKPVETGWAGPGEWSPDGERLALAARSGQGPREVVPVVYSEPLAPLIAARRAGAPVDLEVLDRAFDEASLADWLIVEGAGGIAVPVTEEVDMAGLALRWGLPLLVVARPGLGTINHTALTVHYARARGLSVLAIVLNGMAAGEGGVAEKTNPEAIARATGLPVFGPVPILTYPEDLDAAADFLPFGRLFEIWGAHR